MNSGQYSNRGKYLLALGITASSFLSAYAAQKESTNKRPIVIQEQGSVAMGDTTEATPRIVDPTANRAARQSGSESLSPKQQAIITIATYTARGDLAKLEKALHEGLDAGLTVNEAKEVLVHLYAYCGFPRSIRGLQTLMAVLDERKAKGINDEWGAEASTITDERSKYERGREILGKLTGAPQAGPKTGYSAFSPEIEVFLKEHLFADLFERDVLSYAKRELVTISVLSSLGGLESMLRGHLGISLNVGFTPDQLRHFVRIILSTVGKKEAKAASAVVDDVLKDYKPR
jgi:4-carboxymuconolactone decarboxylase